MVTYISFKKSEHTIKKFFIFIIKSLESLNNILSPFILISSYYLFHPI